jgi:RimJ/RimL family protein N-acetyltransferase
VLAALAALLRGVTARPLRARADADSAGSVRVLQRNGFVPTGSQDAFAAARGATVTELIFELPAGPR